MIHQIGRKLRQQIHYFSGELCTKLGKVSSRFVEEAIFGISASGSVRLTEIGRVLEEKIGIYSGGKSSNGSIGHDSNVRGRETVIYQPERRLSYQLPFWISRLGAGSCGNTRAELAPTRYRDGTTEIVVSYPVRGACRNRRP